MNGRSEFAAKCVTAATVVFALALVLLSLWQASTLMLLLFAGVLLAVFLRDSADWLTQKTKLTPGWSLTAVVLVLCLLFTILGIWIAPRLSAQADELLNSLPRAINTVRSQLERYAWGRQILYGNAVTQTVAPDAASLLTRVTGAFATGFKALADVILVLALGLFLAAEPRIYVETVIRLVSPHSRERVRSVMKEIGDVLGRWLVTRLTAMIYVGILTAIGLWLIGVPLALALAVLTMALGFIPNLGPFIAAAPAILLALLQGPATAGAVALLYFVIEMTEGYIVTPLLQRRAIAMPPALQLVAQVALGLFFGFPGLLLATPLTAAVLVCIHRFYVEDALGDKGPQGFPPYEPHK